jgi:Ca2+-binding RTX toxin-like protein
MKQHPALVQDANLPYELFLIGNFPDDPGSLSESQNSNSLVASTLHLVGLDIDSYLPMILPDALVTSLKVPGTDTILSVGKRVFGTTKDDTINGWDRGDSIQGDNGNDVIRSYGRDNRTEPEISDADMDTMRGGEGNDMFELETPDGLNKSQAIIYGDAGADTIKGYTAPDESNPESGINVIVHDDGAQTTRIEATDFSDQIVLSGSAGKYEVVADSAADDVDTIVINPAIRQTKLIDFRFEDRLIIGNQEVVGYKTANNYSDLSAVDGRWVFLDLGNGYVLRQNFAKLRNTGGSNDWDLVPASPAFGNSTSWGIHGVSIDVATRTSTESIPISILRNGALSASPSIKLNMFNIDYFDATGGSTVDSVGNKSIGLSGTPVFSESDWYISSNDTPQNQQGSSAADNFSGGAAMNNYAALEGNDTIDLGLKDDIGEGGAGGDQINGGPGFDTASYNTSGSGVSINLKTAAMSGGHAAGDVLISIEAIIGSSFADTVTGDDASNRLDGGSGNDSLVGGVGNDTLLGGTGNDTLSGEAGNDRLDGGDSSDTLLGGEGIDWLEGAAGNDSLTGGNGADTLVGGAGRDTLTGSAGADLFRFSALTDSQNISGSVSPDLITDFSLTEDKIDLTGLGFTTLTTAGTTAAGQLRLGYSATTDRTFIRTDQSDFEIALQGDFRSTLNNSHFIFGTMPPANKAPIVSAALSDQSGTVGAAFSYQFGVTSFTDPDAGDTLSYTPVFNDGALPNWLSFNADTRTFSGTPTAVFSGTIVVAARDSKGATVTDNFLLTVTAASSAGNSTILGTSVGETLTGSTSSELIWGYGGNDSLGAAAGADTLIGGLGVDTLTGGAGADVFRFYSVRDSLDTLSGGSPDRITDFSLTEDKIDLAGLGFTGLTTAGTTAVGELRLAYSSTSNRTFVRSDQSDFEVALDGGDFRTTLTNSHFIFSAPSTITGTTSAQTHTGTAASEAINGLAGNDTLLGGAGDDTLNGGLDRDTLTGGAGADVFRFTAANESRDTLSGGSPDIITDFTHGEDLIDLRGLGFTLLTSATSTAAGELRLAYSGTSNRTFIRSDQSEFEVALDGDHRATLTADDFLFA